MENLETVITVISGAIILTALAIFIHKSNNDAF